MSDMKPMHGFEIDGDELVSAEDRVTHGWSEMAFATVQRKDRSGQWKTDRTGENHERPAC
jgi:hypothetical protein